MDNAFLAAYSLAENSIQPLLITSNSSTPEEALEILIDLSRSSDGRSKLASKNILPTVLQLCQNLSYPFARYLLLLSLRLLRNLCAGEAACQNSFIDQNGVGTVLTTLNSSRIAANSDYEMTRVGLQVLSNVSLAGEEHQCAIWRQLFPLNFIEIARIQRRETCDPLCMIVYTCSTGSAELISELCGDQGLPVIVEIVRTASRVGFGEDWLKLLLSRVCLGENKFPQTFDKLSLAGTSKNFENIKPSDRVFVPEQVFLLNILSEILNEQMGDIFASNNCALCVFGILKQAVEAVDSNSKGKSGLLMGSVDVDVIRYSLTILRDICACDSLKGFGGEVSVDVVDSLVSLGLLDFLLCLLRDLEPPSIIRKAMRQGENQEGTSSNSHKLCPYKGFRRDIVAVIGNCAYQRKHVQDAVRQKNGIILLLQQCVTDEDNPFLREWGIWSVRNLLEGNAENQYLVAELELQRSIDVPEITGLGLRVEVDQKTQRAKLVNI